MFVIDDNPTFSRQVTVRIPVDGGYDDQSFVATFRLLDFDETDGFNTLVPEGMRSFLQTVIVGLDDIAGKDGKLIPYSNSLRDMVINNVPAMNALFDTYSKAVAEARVGN